MKIPSAREFYTPRNQGKKNHYPRKGSSCTATPVLQQAAETFCQVEEESGTASFSDILISLAVVIIIFGGLFWLTGFWLGLAIFSVICFLLGRKGKG